MRVILSQTINPGAHAVGIACMITSALLLIHPQIHSCLPQQTRTGRNAQPAVVIRGCEQLKELCMFSLLRRMSLPLLLKELLEQAARRRTYLIRIIYVLLLSYFSLASIALQLQSRNPLNVLGQGTPILRSLVEWQFGAIFVLLPGMACGVLTTEKERNTLALLFLTRLGPWTIIIEKLLSRLLPMSTFLMCGLPIIAFTYSLGGLTFFQLFIAAYYLLLGVVLTGCVAVMCSALSNTTIGAFIQTYVVLFLLRAALPIVGMFLPPAVTHALFEGLIRSTVSLTASASPGLSIYAYGVQPGTLTLVLSPWGLFSDLIDPAVLTPVSPWGASVVLGIPSLLASLTCLGIARWALYRRAFVASSNPLLNLFRGIDKVFFWANRKIAFDVKLVRESDSLPDDEPIAWREVSKRSLGQFRYLVRIMIPLMFPVLFVGAFIATSSAADYRVGGNGGLAGMIWFLWSVSLLLITITAANTIPLERARQTWDVLRSTPLTGREILTQKLRGVRRLQWVCSIPVFSAIGLQAWLRYQLHSQTNGGVGYGSGESSFIWWEYLAGAIGSVVIYSELVKWISLWCGLTVRNSMRAVLLSVLVIGMVSVLPQVPLVVVASCLMNALLTDLASSVITVVRCINPWIFIVVNEFGDMRQLRSVPLMPALANLAAHGGILWLVYHHLMHRADWYLGRIGGPRSLINNESVASDASRGSGVELGLPQQPDDSGCTIKTVPPRSNHV